MNVYICRTFTRLFVESFFFVWLQACTFSFVSVCVFTCAHVLMAGSVALERRIAVSLEGPISLFVSQDAAGFRLMHNDIKISCSDARSRSICLSAHVTWQTSCFRSGPRTWLRPKRVSLFRWHDCCSWHMSSWWKMLQEGKHIRVESKCLSQVP